MRGRAPDVAFVLPRLASGGVERVVANLAASLHRRGRAVDLVLMRAEGSLLNQLDEGVRVVDLRMPVVNDAAFGLALPWLVRYLRRHRPAIVYTGMTTVNLTALAARRLARSRTRIVVSEHVPVSINATTHPLKRVLPRLIRLGYPHADAMVAVATALADDLAATCRLPRDRIEVLYNPVVTPRLQEDGRAAPPHPWLADDVPVVLGIGRLSPQKDFETLLEAFALLRARRPARLLVLGEGPERARLETAAERLGVSSDVDLHGFVEDPGAYLAHADVFALSSRYEGLALVVIEALACGCQVVSTDCRTGPREILEGGRFGRLVPVSDPAALAGAMAEALEAPLPVASLRGRASHFAIDTVTDRYLELFDRVAPPSPPRPR